MSRDLRYRVEGPFLRADLPSRPVFLIVVKGLSGKVKGRPVKRKPAFYLVSAIQEQDDWVLPLAIKALLAWAWQRWELEVEHREILNTLWRAYRAALWQTHDFPAVWTETGENWLKMDDRMAGLWNSVSGAARA